MTDEPPRLPAAQRWFGHVEGWAIPPAIMDAAPESPWAHDVAQFEVGATPDRSSTSTRWARELLPPLGGTVLDIGCGRGGASLALIPPATEVIGVDSSGAMLDEFVAAASDADVARRTVHGAWPDVAPVTPIADVVVCHHVVAHVAEIVPFVVSLTSHARLGVVVEVPTLFPMSAWAPAWRHFWGIERPNEPTAELLIDVLRELGLDPEYTVGPRSPTPPPDPSSLVRAALRRLCLSPDRDAEVSAWLAAHPPQWHREAAVVRWPGAAEGGS